MNVGVVKDRVKARLVLAGLLLAIAAAPALTWYAWRAIPQANTRQQTFDVILVLGAPSLKDGSPSSEQRVRVLEAARAWRRGDAPRLVVSGTAAHNRWVEADAMATLAAQQGVPPEDIFEERQALNTIQNVYYTVAIMQAHGWKSAEVVSSWNHLPRAAMILAHFPILWRTLAAPWPPEYLRGNKLYLDWREAVYCMLLRVVGFHPSRFISR